MDLTNTSKWSRLILRIRFTQQWFGLSDPATEEALHDILIYREFAHLDAGISRIPDETTILRFRRLLEEHKLADQILAAVNVTLVQAGLLLKAEAAVDATLIRKMNESNKTDQPTSALAGVCKMSSRDFLIT